MVKNLSFLLATLCLSLPVTAQQETQYTQFMYNKLGYNPGYAGSLGGICATAIVRGQWLGLDGAPKSQVLSLDAALSQNRVGLGLNLARTSQGIASHYRADAAYTYRFSVGNGTLGVGVQGSLLNYTNNFADERLVATDGLAIDQSIPDNRRNKTVPNFGTGLYYKTDRWYLGVSAPRLLTNNLDFSDNTTVEARSVRHIYAMAGYAFRLNENVQLQPQFLFKYARNTPADLDANLSFIFINRYLLGATYRTGGASTGAPLESLDILFSAQLNDQMLFGLAYDVTVTDLRNFSSGSIEAMVRYCFKAPVRADGETDAAGGFLNPRFF